MLPYNPGVIPTRPAPAPGETVTFKVDGLPPFKEPGRSLRNGSHPNRAAFVNLREAAIKAMDGRAWYSGKVSLTLYMWAVDPPANRRLYEFVSGILDTLDGSHGKTFTYLPIVFEDDNQVRESHSQFQEGDRDEYVVIVEFR